MTIKSQAVAVSRCGCEPGPGKNNVVTMVTDNNVKPGAPAVPEDTEAAFRSLCAEHGPARLGLTTVAQHLAVSVDKTGLRAAIATLPRPQQQALTEVQYRDRSAAET